MKRMIALLFALAVGGGAQAGLISYNGYTHDTDTDIVKGGGLDWLQWDVTRGSSISSAGSYFDAGWRLATFEEMADLYGSWGFDGVSWDPNQELRQALIVPHVVGGEEVKTTSFVSLFGETYNIPWSSSDPMRSTAAIFGSDPDGDGLYRLAEVRDDYYQTNVDYDGDGIVSIERDFVSLTSRSSSWGLALVRESQAVSVPEPSSLALLGLGLLAVVTRRWKTS